MTAGQIIVAVSALGGIIGGMGMGGGTLLIPLLTLAAGLEQHLAQSINLIAFVPMSIVALLIHKKNGYVELRSSLPVICFATLGAIGGSFAARYSGGYILRACYGSFLIALGAFQLGKVIKSLVKSIREKNERKKSASVKHADSV